MAENRHPGPEHESSDINVRAIALFAGGMILTAIFILWGLYGLFWLYASVYGNPPGPVVTASQLPPQPRLQTAPDTDWTRMKAETDRRLDTYGWIDRANGKTHIPIERAMVLIVERGLPVAPLPETAAGIDGIVMLKGSGREVP